MQKIGGCNGCKCSRAESISLDYPVMKRANSRINPGDLVDRISALPDSVLSLILSFLPTKNAVSTTILSKRWKFMWTTVHNLDFRLDNCKMTADKAMKFARFVNLVLLLHDGGFLNMFRLVWRPWCIPSQVSSWITTAITRNVHELYLCLDNSGVPFEVPSSVFSCDTLKSLELNGNMFLSDSIAVYLRTLERLKLVSVYFQSDEAFQKLISGCPVLNYLHIDMDIDDIKEYFHIYEGTVFTYIISSTSLRRLELYVRSISFNVYGDMPHCRLELKASSLEYLKLVGFISRIFVQESLSSLVEADFRIKMCLDEFSEASICNSLVEAVRALDCAKALTLSRYALWALSRATICMSTKFKRLSKLEAGADCCCSSLRDFIQSSDSLEVLTIYKHRNCLDQNNHAPSTWLTPVEIPRCLSNSLKVVVVDGFAGFENEIKMIDYMLQHGSALEVMQVSCARYMSFGVKFELLQQICQSPRKSLACKVDFFRRRSVANCCIYSPHSQ